MDLLVEDRFWFIHYLVVESDGLTILLVPDVITKTDIENRTLELSLTNMQVRDSPPTDRHLPISANRLRGAQLSTTDLPSDPLTGVALRSCNKLLSYQVSTNDNTVIGIRDHLVQTTNWQLRYLLLTLIEESDDRLVSLDFVGQLRWLERMMQLSLSKQELTEQDHFIPSSLSDNNMWNTEHIQPR